MKQLLTLTVACICSLQMTAFGQSVFDKGAVKYKTLDEASLRCYYIFSKKKEGAEKPYRSDTMLLDIGTKVSKFCDPARLGRDSLLLARMNGYDPSTIKSFSVFKGESARDISEMPGTTSSSAMEGESYQLIKDKLSGKITVLDYVNIAGDKFKYEDEAGPLAWTILKDTATIAAYSCQKATLSFRGRDYVAWFAADIPVSDGPWKFAGLPGLILQIADTKGLFAFKLIGLMQLSSPLPIQFDDTKSIKCTRADMAKQKKVQGAGLQVNFNGGNMILAEIPGKFDYSPMETE